MVIFHSYVSLPEGISPFCWRFPNGWGSYHPVVMDAHGLGDSPQKLSTTQPCPTRLHWVPWTANQASRILGMGLNSSKITKVFSMKWMIHPPIWMDVWYYSHLLYEWMFLSWLWIWYTQQTRLLPCKCFRFACGFSFQKPPKGGSMCSKMMLSQNNKPTVGWFGNLVLGAPMLSGFHLAPISPCEDMERTVIRWQGPTAGLSTSKNHHFGSISGLTMVYGRYIYI